MFNFCCKGIFYFIFRTLCWKLQVASSRKSEHPSQSNICVELWNLVTAVNWVIQYSCFYKDILNKMRSKFFSLQAVHENICENTRFILMIFAEYNQQDANFLNLFISVRQSTCFSRFLRPSSGAQNCTYSVRHFSDQYCYLLLACRLAASSSNDARNYQC
jgi:hypothetical protein